MAYGPNTSTPIADLVLTTREIAQWTGRNAAKLQAVVTEDFGGEDAGRAAAALLDGEEADYQTERRQDVAWTNEKDALIARIEPLEDAVTAGVEMAYYDDPDLHDMLRDFAIGPPSRIATLPKARAALQKLISGMESHEDALRGSMGKYDQVIEECRDLHQRAGDLSDTFGNEAAETRAAGRDRKTARQQCLDYIKRVELAARMARVDHPDLLDEIDAIYAKFVPQPTPAADPEPTEA